MQISNLNRTWPVFNPIVPYVAMPKLKTLPSDVKSLPNRAYPKFLARYPALQVFLIALAARLVWTHLARDCVPIDDAAMYLRLGKTLAETGAYLELGRPTAYMPVGYPFFLSLFFRIVPDPHFLILGVQILLSSWTCALVQRLAMRLGASPRAALWAGLALAVFPSSMGLATTFLVETLFTFLVLTSFFGATAPNKILAIGSSGVLLGLACFVRPVAMILIPLLFLPDILSGRWRRYLSSTLLAGVILVLVALPWGLRNKALFGRVVLHSTNGGVSLYTGHNPEATGVYMYNSDIDSHDSIINEAVRSRIFADQAMHYIRTHPLQEVKLFAKKFAILLLRDRVTIYEGLVKDPGNRNFGWPVRILALINNLYYLVLLALFLMIRWWRPHKNRAILITAGLAFWFQILFYCCFFVSDRYKFPAIPFLLLCLTLSPPFLIGIGHRRLIPSLFLIIIYPLVRILMWLIDLPLRNKKAIAFSERLPNLSVYQSYQVGDAFMAMPALQLLKSHFTITVVCRPDCQGIFQGEGFQVRAHDNLFFAHATPVAFWRSLKAAWKLRRQIPFPALDFDADPRTAFMLKIAGAGTTYSPKRPLGWFFDKTFSVVTDARHQSDRQLAVAEAFLLLHGLSPHKPTIIKSPITGVTVRAPRILISCWTWKDEKNWPLDYWGQLIKYLMELKCQIDIIVPPDGDAGFRNFHLQWKDQVDFFKGDLDKIHQKVIAADGIICTDNFLGHMAAFKGKPIFWINGSSDPELVTPRGPGTKIVQVDSMPCRPCGHRCRNPIYKKCLNELLPEQVKGQLELWFSHYLKSPDFS